jgi:dihydroneopterin aldolase
MSENQLVQHNLDIVNTDDSITLKGMTFYAFHGHRESERDHGVIIEVDVVLNLTLDDAMNTDDLKTTVDYRQVYFTVEEAVMTHQHNLLERVVKEIMKALFENFKKVNRIQVKLRKPSPSLGGVVKYVEIAITRDRRSMSGI